MNIYLMASVCVVLLSLIIGLIRVFIGPTPSDRMIVTQLFGTAGVAILILLSVSTGQSSLLNVAISLALLAPIALVAFVNSDRR